jgi:RNA methyltransferase, TrmH family
MIKMAEVITSSGNEFVKYARSLKNKKARVQNSAFLVEGEKCVAELAEHMPKLAQSVIVIEGMYRELTDKIREAGAKVYYVSESVLDSISETKTPQGIAAISLLPEYGNVYSGFIVMLDDVQDPQNVGTIIRTADAAGCSCVVLSEECADCFSPKAVRASMGSIFHIPVIRAGLPGYITELASKGYETACADIRGDTEFDLNWNNTCLIIGNESRGVSEDIRSLSSKLVKIPMYGKAESLNAAVAAGILIYKIRT